MFFNGKKLRYPVSFAAVFLLFMFVFLPTVCAQGSSDTSTGKKTERSSEEYRETINEIFSFVEKNYVNDIDPRILYEGALKGMMEALEDPYSVYLKESQSRDMQDTTVGQFGGVGLTITKAASSTPDAPAFVEVSGAIEDSPGYKAGIQTGDLIVAIGDVSTADITMDDVLKKLRGVPGTDVTITIRRGKTNMEFDVTLTRAVIEVPTVKYGMIGKTGYLKIIEFTPQTPNRVLDALTLFEENAYKNLVIDLRNNPGGLISSVYQIADFFIDEGPIVSTKDRNGKGSTYQAHKRRTCVDKNLPIVVLINRGSASASEILAGALKDNHLAYLVGENTFGKGSVQQIKWLNQEEGVKLTMAKYYTPSDCNIDKVGIPPDREILFPVLTEAEEKTYLELYDSKKIEKYVESHPSMTQEDVARYAEVLKKSYNLEPRVLRRMINIQVYRTQKEPIYDLDFDIQLKEALSILEKENFASLMKKTKTIRELQAEQEKTKDK